MKTKRYLPAIIFLFSFTAVFTQEYEYAPFPDSNAVWNIYLESTCDDSSPDTSILRFAICGGDTVINDTSYNKLCFLNCSEKDDTANNFNVTNPIGLLRENNRKIFYRGSGYLGMLHRKEILLYDFTRDIGDTIFHSEYHRTIIKDIDSIKIDGNYRKRYKVKTGSYVSANDYIIEGIGYIKNGVLGHITEVPTCGYHYWEFICLKQNGTVKYLNPNFRACFPVNLLTLIQNYPNNNNNINIYPNPINNDLLKFDFGKIEIQYIKIMNVNGNITDQIHVNDQSTSVFSTKTYSKGIYLYRAITKDGKIHTGKFIVK